jgi:protein SCO1/2
VRAEPRRRAAGVVLAGLLTALAACGGQGSTGPVAGFTEHNPDGMNGVVLPQKYVVPDVTLTATDGSDFSLTEDTEAPVTLFFFGYTHCPDICQIVMSDIASALTRLDSEQKSEVDVVFVTTDPARDDEATLRDYLDRFNPDFEGLTGDLKTISKAGNALGVAIEKGKRLPSGGYDVTHGTQVIAVDRTDRAPMVWTEGTPAAQIAEDLSKLLAKTESSPSS